MGSVLDDAAKAMMAKSRPWWALGMTETLGPYSWGDELRAPGYPLCAPLDHITPGYELRVVRADGSPVAEYEAGEIQLRGYAVTRRLYKANPKDHFTDDGYLRTGDMGIYEGARLHFVGRHGDMIKTAGSNVSPAEVEWELQQFAEIESAYVLGVPDAEKGQIVVAVVVAAEGIDPEFAKITNQLRERLSSYKIPRRFWSIDRREIPLLPSNKINRRELTAILEAWRTQEDSNL
jgi:acyl-CoA synthetase (AMP-forming)/AMP-acid ligase II